MKKYLLLLTALIMMLPFASQAKDKDEVLEYQIEGAGTGTQGTYLVKVTVISKDKKIDNDLIARCAVHGVLFRGFSSKEFRQNQRPLAGSAANEAQHADYYKEFFKKGGPAKSYVTGLDSSRSVVKSGKNYQISTIVTVNKDQLQRDLEQAGVIRGLNSAF